MRTVPNCMKYKILKILIFAFLILEVSNIYAKDVDRVPVFYAIVPGGTHFYDGDMKEGMAFSITEVSLLTIGVLINNKLEKDSRTELNLPLLLASQLYAIDKWRYFQKTQLRFRQKYPNYKSIVKLNY